MKELIEIQHNLKAPKGQWNNFGKYKYRSCEDILEALKPLLYEHKCELTIADDMVFVGTRIYVKATVTLKNENGEIVSTTAYAREEESKKGMDGSQVTGAASSYARKYALNGMFCIDDTKDSDDTNTDGKDDGLSYNRDTAFQEIDAAKDTAELSKIYNKYTMLHADKAFMERLGARKKEVPYVQA